MASDDDRDPEVSPRSVEVPVDSQEDVPVAVVFAVAEALGRDPDDLSVELNEFVDADALTKLFAPRPDGRPRTEGRVVFEMLGCEVIVESAGVVRVSPPSASSDRGPASGEETAGD
jgi:hypothetical protein